MLKLTIQNYQTKEKTLYQDFEFEFPDHGLFCIFGPNGSGKTTILNLLSGRMFLKSSELFYNEKKISAKNGTGFFEKNISFLTQDPIFIEQLSVINNLVFPENDYDEQIVNQILSRYKLEDKKEQEISSLSSGEKQRFSFARADYQNKPIILCDEPFANLDAESQAILETQMRVLSKKHLIIITTNKELLNDEYWDILSLSNHKLSIEKKHQKEVDDDVEEISINQPNSKDRKHRFQFAFVLISIFAFIFSFLGYTFGSIKYSIFDPEIRSNCDFVFLKNNSPYFLVSPTFKEELIPQLSEDDYELFIIDPIRSGEETTLGSMSFGKSFPKDFKSFTLLEGRYPEKPGEILVSDVNLSYITSIGHTVDDFYMPNKVVGIYKADTQNCDQTLIAGLSKAKYSLPRAGFTFHIESTLGILRDEDEYRASSIMVRNTPETQKLITSDMRYYYTPTSENYLLDKNGKFIYENQSTAHKETYVFLSSFLIICFYIIFALAIIGRKKKEFLFKRMMGVSRDKLFQSEAKDAIFASGLAAVSAFIVSALTLLLMNVQIATSPYLSFMMYLVLDLFSVLIPTLFILLGTIIYLLLIRFIALPSNLTKQLSELKRK